MQRMKHPFDLPVTLLTEVLTVWLDLSSLMALDSASCSVVSRTAFLGVVGSVGFCLDKASTSIAHQNMALSWFETRGVKAKRVWIDGSIDLDIGVLTTFLQNSGAYVENLRIMKFKDKQMLSAILGLIGFSSQRPTCKCCIYTRLC
jgi:hypothetical protein